MIENKTGIENLDKILKVKGLDAILIGPYDLSASLGITGNFENKLFKKSEKEILKISKKHKIPTGFHIVKPSERELAKKINEGFRFIAYSIDTVFLNEFAVSPSKKLNIE